MLYVGDAKPLVVYPQCPKCGTTNRRQPVYVANGRVLVFVEHHHDACPVYRYAVHARSNREQESYDLRGQTFEDFVQASTVA